jgi:hypothetical protein
LPVPPLELGYEPDPEELVGTVLELLDDELVLELLEDVFDGGEDVNVLVEPLLPLP